MRGWRIDTLARRERLAMIPECERSSNENVVAANPLGETVQ